jgi:hypothetical protein
VRGGVEESARIGLSSVHRLSIHAVEDGKCARLRVRLHLLFWTRRTSRLGTIYCYPES